MLLPLVIFFTWTLNPFLLGTQGCAWVPHVLHHSPGNDVSSWLNQILQPYLLPIPLGSAFSSKAEIGHAPTLQNKSILIPQLPAQADDRVREHSFLFSISYMLTGKQLGNHRENTTVLGTRSCREVLSLLGIKSVDISPRLIQALCTVTLHHFLFNFSESSSRVPSSFSLSPG